MLDDDDVVLLVTVLIIDEVDIVDMPVGVVIVVVDGAAVVELVTI